jgi:hypothetical protein
LSSFPSSSLASFSFNVFHSTDFAVVASSTKG